MIQQKALYLKIRDSILILLVSFLSISTLNCIQKSSANLEEEALLQLRDFFDKQNKLFERQKRYEFQQVLHFKKLNRKRAEVTLEYKFIDNYMTVDRTEEIKRSTFLLQWQEKGKLVVTPDGETQRVRWVLSRTWDYDREKQ